MKKAKTETEHTMIKTDNVFSQKPDRKLYALSRWAALYESINMIADKADEKKVNFDKVELKPLKILEYVDAMSDIIMRKLLQEKTEKKVSK